MSVIQKFIGPRYIELARNWRKTGVTWLAIGSLAAIWLCDWKAVLGYVPVIKDKYKEEEE